MGERLPRIGDHGCPATADAALIGDTLETRCEVTRRDDANAVMFTQDEKVAIAGHYGRCFPCDRGGEDSVVVVRIPRDICEV